jgi:hypothetical protein
MEMEKASERPENADSEPDERSNSHGEEEVPRRGS